MGIFLQCIISPITFIAELIDLYSNRTGIILCVVFLTGTLTWEDFLLGNIIMMLIILLIMSYTSVGISGELSNLSCVLIIQASCQLLAHHFPSRNDISTP